MNVQLLTGYAIANATCTVCFNLANDGKRKTAVALLLAISAGVMVLAVMSCASPTAPVDPCAKPDNPKGCTPPSCARPVCY